MSKPGLGHRHQTIARILRAAAAAGEPCHLCGKPIDTRPEAEGGPRPRSTWAFAADHLRSRAKGGQTVLSNYAPAHYGCNSGKREGGRGKDRKTTKKPTRTKGLRKW